MQPNRPAAQNGRKRLDSLPNVPFDELAEIGLVTSPIGAPHRFAEVADISPRHFVREDLGALWSVMKEIHAEGGLVTAQSVHAKLFENGQEKLKKVGTAAELVKLLNGADTGSNIIWYAGQVREKARLRELQRQAIELNQLISSGASLEDASEFAAGMGQAMNCPQQIEPPIYYEDFRQRYSRLPAVRIDGLQRHGEVLNLIAATKVGKSWTTYEIIWRLLTGGMLWDRFQCTACNVLLIDNELDPRVLSDRLARVKAALRIDDRDIQGRFATLPLRGQLLDFDGVRRYLDKHVKPGDFQYTAFDAYYRLLPPGIDENSNSDGAQIANKVDAIARDFDTSVLLVHHATKGNQSGKSVTDVGSGASAMARAADTHLVLRPHEEAGVVVGEAALRSFAPVDPFCLRWDFPLWKPIDNLDTSKLRTTAQPKATLNQIAENVFNWLRDNGTQTKTQISKNVHINGTKVNDALDLLIERGHVEACVVEINRTQRDAFRVSRTPPDSPDCQGVCQDTNIPD